MIHTNHRRRKGKIKINRKYKRQKTKERIKNQKSNQRTKEKKRKERKRWEIRRRAVRSYFLSSSSIIIINPSNNMRQVEAILSIHFPKIPSPHGPPIRFLFYFFSSISNMVPPPRSISRKGGNPATNGAEISPNKQINK